MMQISDSQLISRYQSGDEQALASLIEKYQKDIYTFIYYKVRDEDLANDFFQDTFIKIITKLKEHKYSEENKFLLWAKRVAYNLIIDYYRAKSRQHYISEMGIFQEEETSIFDFISSDECNVEELLISDQICKDLENILLYLPENQKEIVKMRFYDGLAFKDIAELTNTSINTVLGRVRYALLNIRKIIEKNNINLTSQ